MAIHTIFLRLLFTTLASLLHHLIHKRMEARAARHNLPPGPMKLPIIGNLHQLGTLPHRSLWLLSRKHGPLMHLRLGNMPTLVVSSADMAREVLKIHDLDFCWRPQLFASENIFYYGKDIGFAPYGEYWREIRKICILELFSSRRVQSFRSVREEEVALMIGSIARSSSIPIDLSNMTSSLASGIICRVALGKKYQKGEYGNNRFYGILQEVQALLSSFFVVDFFPSMGWADRLSGVAGRLEKCVGELDAFYEQVIEEHLDPNRTGPEREDIVDVLLHLQHEARHITKDHVKAVITDIFVGGTETGSATLVWAMAELARNPRPMMKAQEEIRASVGNKGKVEEGDLHQLQYLKSVVKETFRLHCPVPLLLPREAVRQCKIDQYDILPKTRVYVNSWGIGRDPESWEDPDEFLPERFMDGSVDFKGHDFQLIPFGSGRRICPAMNFGVATIELALANLLYSFEWELPVGMNREDIDMNEAPGLTTHKRGALNLVATNHSIN